MKRPRQISSFDSQDEYEDYLDDRADAHEGEAQAADDAWSDEGDE